jgi:hypothetical protein
MPEILPRVRIATHDDEDDLIDLLWNLHAENGMRSSLIDNAPVTANEQKVRLVLRQAFDSVEGKHPGPPSIIGVIGGPGDLHGSIYLTMQQPWYSDHWQISELYNYVLPEHRKSRKAEALIEFAKHFADHTRCYPLLIGISIGDPEDTRLHAKMRFYRRFLGQSRGTLFAYTGTPQKSEAI